MQIQTVKNRSLGFLQRLSDARFVGQLLFVLAVLLLSWSGIKTIQTNYGLQKQIASLEKQNDLQALSNDNLKLQNQYYNSNQYLELAARQNFGLGKPGEKELIVPKRVALAYTVELPEPTMQAKVASTERQPAYKRNLESWLGFFLNRQSGDN